MSEQLRNRGGICVDGLDNGDGGNPGQGSQKVDIASKSAAEVGRKSVQTHQAVNKDVSVGTWVRFPQPTSKANVSRSRERLEPSLNVDPFAALARNSCAFCVRSALDAHESRNWTPRHAHVAKEDLAQARCVIVEHGRWKDWRARCGNGECQTEMPETRRRVLQYGEDVWRMNGIGLYRKLLDAVDVDSQGLKDEPQNLQLTCSNDVEMNFDRTLHGSTKLYQESVEGARPHGQNLDALAEVGVLAGNLAPVF